MRASSTAPFRVTICGLNELDLHCEAGVTHVLSILDPEWPEPAAFLAFSPHRRLELRFHDVIGPDATGPQPQAILPEAEHVERLLALGHDLAALGAGAHLLVHCHAGVSRSTASAALLLAQAEPNRAADEVFAEIARIRPRAWPNLRLLELGDRALGRGGTLVAAVGAQYRRIIDADPEFVRFIRRAGRGREADIGENFRS
jgi:predicted protein tyrosine phosphatase